MYLPPRLAVAAVLLATTGIAFSQAPNPTFEVATIKLGDPTRMGSDWGFAAPDRFRMRGVTLRQGIQFAYEIQEFELLDGPGWVGTQTFDIVGASKDMAGAADRFALARTMLRTLLADRFALRMRQETRTLSGYELQPAKGGAKLKPPSERPGKPLSSWTQHRSITAATMKLFVDLLSHEMQRPVVNATGIDGPYDIELKWTGDLAANAELGSAPTGPSIFSALQEQLGLKLESKKVPVAVWVIERAEKPEEN